jgi:hypothetical protein
MPYQPYRAPLGSHCIKIKTRTHKFFEVEWWFGNILPIPLTIREAATPKEATAIDHEYLTRSTPVVTSSGGFCAVPEIGG